METDVCVPFEKGNYLCKNDLPHDPDLKSNNTCRCRGFIIPDRNQVSQVTRKPVFRGLQPGKTRTGLLQMLASLEILEIPSICIILSMQRKTKALIRLHGWAG